MNKQKVIVKTKIATRNVDADDAINIKRDWKWDGYEATGDFDVNIFVPDHNMGKGNIKGCAFFIHGFLQGPSAYSCTLQKAAETANVAIIAVKTGICDKHIILEGMGRIPFVRRFNPVSLSFVLQCAVSEDTKQCIRMVLKGDQVFQKYGINKNIVKKKMAVMGHSMGGGLSFHVAEAFSKNIDYVFTMAPFSGVPKFNAVNSIKRHAVGNSMLLAGEWDILAHSCKVKEMTATSNANQTYSSIFVEAKQGFHTGFQNKVEFGGYPILYLIPELVTYYSFVNEGFLSENQLVLFALLMLEAFLLFLNANQIRTGQLDGTRALMEYFLVSMTQSKDLSLDIAARYVCDNNHPDSPAVNNFAYSYPITRGEENRSKSWFDDFGNSVKNLFNLNGKQNK